MKKLKWFESEEDLCKPYQLKAPYDNIWVGEDPRDGMKPATAESYQAIVNVSDTPGALFEPAYPTQRTYWYPLNELGAWSQGYLFWLVKVLDYHYERGDKIYLHCHAGAFRSPSAAVLWLQSRGHSPEEALELGSRSGIDSGLYRIQALQGNIPKSKAKLFKAMYKYPDWSLGSLLLSDRGVPDVWNPENQAGVYQKDAIRYKYLWFWYQPKWWVKDKWGWFEYWLKGMGWTRVGTAGTNIYPRKHFWSWGRDAEPKDLDFWNL